MAGYTGEGLLSLSSPSLEIKSFQLFWGEAFYVSGQISIIPKPELRGFWGSSLFKPPFRVTSADVVIICPDVLPKS